jgi:long-chain acyl-CoA synthetase
MSEHLASFERIKRFIGMEPLTIEDNELTPTLKVKRAIVERKLKKEIDALYAAP